LIFEVNKLNLIVW